MDFVHVPNIRYVPSIRLAFLFTLLVVTQSLPTLNITDSEGREYRDITIHVINETFPATIMCSTEAQWSVQPDLPKGLMAKPYKDTWRVFGLCYANLPKTTFTVTAVTQEGAASITFNLTCSGCEDGDIYEFRALGHIQFSYQGDNIDITRKCWQCMKKVVYTYTSYNIYSYIYMYDANDECVMHLSETGNITGELDLTGNSPPILVLPNQVQVNSSTVKYVYIDYVNRVTNITLYPPHPKLKISGSQLSIDIDTFYEANHIITVSNEHGSDSQSVHLSVYKCNGGYYYNILHLGWGDTIIVDSHNNTLYNGKQNYFCASDTNISLFFDKEYGDVELLRPVMLYDQHGIAAEYNTDSVPATFHFYKQDIVSTFSTLRISHSFQENWSSKSFDDSLWKEDQGQIWGPFGGESVYFRKRFTIDSIAGFNTMLIDVLAMGDVDIYLNGEYVKHLFGKTYYRYIRFEIPLDDRHIGENVLAACLHKTTDDNIINFDIMIQLIFTPQILQSVLGEVTQETAIPSPNPFYAFIQTQTSGWLLQSVPAALVFRFNDTEKRIVNRVYFQVPSDNFLTKVKVEAIDLDENKNITLYSSPSDFMNRFMNYRVVDFDNSIAYPAYRVTIESTSSPNATKIQNIRLYRDMIPTCPQTKKMPETRGNATVFSRCGLFYSGKKQNRCEIDGSKTHWEEDRSTCLSRLPPRNYAFVDFTFRLVHVIPTMFNSTMKDQLVALLVEKTAVRPEEVHIIYNMDSSDSENSAIDVFIRIIVKQAGGDYIAEQLDELKYSLTDSVHTFIAEELDGMIIGKIRIYISWKPEIIILILILVLVLLILVVFAIYGVSAYIRDRKQKTKSLKRRKMNEEELLINQELSVCS